MLPLHCRCRLLVGSSVSLLLQRAAPLHRSSAALFSTRARGGGGGGSGGSSSGGGKSSGGSRAGASRSGAGDARGSGGGGGGGASAAAAAPAARASPAPSSEILFSVRNLGKALPGGRSLFSGVNLSFSRGAKIGVLGLNGSGKSSLLRILAGVDGEYDGEVWRGGGGGGGGGGSGGGLPLRVGYLAQEPELDASRSVHENIMDGLAERSALLARYGALSAAMAEPSLAPAAMEALLAEQAEVQSAIERADCWDLDHTVAAAKAALRVPPDDAAVATLSGGERRRVALCRLLLEQPELLLLDEPTNHLDASSVAWLERWLAGFRGTVLAVTHDRYFLDNVAGWILELDRGAALPFEGNYSAWLERKAARLDGEKKAERRRARAMAEELQWIRQGPRGRQAKSKARVAAYEALVASAERGRTAERFLSGAIIIPPAPRLGEQVLQLSRVSLALPLAAGGRALLRDVSFSLPRGAIVGIIGGNGTGKTTLLRVIAGELAPDAGSVTLGSTVRLGMVSQSREELAAGGGERRVLDVVADGADTVAVGGYEMPVRQYLAAFNLVGELQTKPVRALSGGERNRVHLARVLRHASNLLILDEPTNDLDVDTLRSLEEALDSYAGCALIVSHDRYFIDRVASHLLIFHGEGRVEFFEGGFSEYEAAGGAEAAARAMQRGAAGE